MPPKDVVVEADSLETNTGNVALLVEGLIQPGDEAIKDSSSASLRRPGIRGYIFAHEEEECGVQYQHGCSNRDDCCGNMCCLTFGYCDFKSNGDLNVCKNNE